MRLLVWNINSIVSRTSLRPDSSRGTTAAARRLPAAARLLPRHLDHQVPTVRNAVLKYGSWAGFFSEHDLDLACLQARLPALALPGGLAGSSAHSIRRARHSSQTRAPSTRPHRSPRWWRRS